MVVVGFALIASTWIIAWHISTQAAIAGAAVMTFAVLGVLGIFWVLNRAQR